MTMQVDKARLDEMLAAIPRYTEGDERNVWAVSVTGTDLVAIITELLELRSLRSTEGKEGEQQRADQRELYATVRKFNCDNADQFWASVNAIRSRAEAAEDHVAKLREALEPFAALYVESMRDFPDGSSKTERPDDKQAWGFNNVDLTWGDFRRAAALTRSPE